MNKSIETLEETAPGHALEERLGRLGSKLDALIARAQLAKDRLLAEEEELEGRGTAALNEMKVAFENAWEDLHEAWKDLAHGVHRMRNALNERNQVMKDEYFDSTGLDETD